MRKEEREGGIEEIENRENKSSTVPMLHFFADQSCTTHFELIIHMDIVTSYKLLLIVRLSPKSYHHYPNLTTVASRFLPYSQPFEWPLNSFTATNYKQNTFWQHIFN